MDIFKGSKPIHTKSLHYEFDSDSVLPEEIRNLLAEARNSVKKAYAPYSHFHVGAALLLSNGVVISGNNQENAAYPSGLCAERVAVFYASAHYPGLEIKAIALTAKAKEKIIDYPISPCGSCRQVLIEYESKQHSPIGIFMTGETGIVIGFMSVADLLPFCFTSKNLK